MRIPYFHNLNRPDFGLARWGITLIPSESLPAFQEIVIADRRINRDEQLAALADKISEAILNHSVLPVRIVADFYGIKLQGNDAPELTVATIAFCSSIAGSFVSVLDMCFSKYRVLT